MEIKILCPYWGHEQLQPADFVAMIENAGYDGLETWMPEDSSTRASLYAALQERGLLLVAHQHEAAGATFKDFQASFLKYLERCAESEPVLINSHTGRDYFSFEQNITLIDIASEFAYRRNVTIAHETHRGRLGSAPFTMVDYFNARKDFFITADFSHWTCVTESLLENFGETLEEAVTRTRHVHARVGFEQGPQIPDPRLPEWAATVDVFLQWWDKIVQENIRRGNVLLTFTTEFGPPPYMATLPFTKKPAFNQFSINVYMKEVLRRRYAAYCG